MKEYHRGFFVVTGLSIGFPTHTKKLKRIFFLSLSHIQYQQALNWGNNKRYLSPRTSILYISLTEYVKY